MANMSYCRFENTLADLRDCYDNMDDPDLSEKEKVALARMLKLCHEIDEDYGMED